MALEAGKSYPCYAESAEIVPGTPDDDGRFSLNVVMKYRFTDTGEVLKGWHCLVKKDGTLMEDKSGVTEIKKLEQRYGVDLSNFEFDNNALSPDIVVKAFLVDHEYKGKKYLKIASVYDADKKEPERKPVDKDLLRRRFGSILRAAHTETRKPTVAPPNAGAPAGQAPKPIPTPSRPAPAKPTGSQGFNGDPSNMDECWNEFRIVNKDMSKADLENGWFNLLDDTFGKGCKQESLTPRDWGFLKVKIQEMEQIPF